MKLSDFGLCKPIDCITLPTLHENQTMDDETLAEPMDIDSCVPDADNRKSWRSPREQLQHWQMNRRKLVCCQIYQYIIVEIGIKICCQMSIMFLNIIGLILKICLNSSVQKTVYLLQNLTTFFQLSFLNASYY